MCALIFLPTYPKLKVAIDIYYLGETSLMNLYRRYQFRAYVSVH